MKKLLISVLGLVWILLNSGCSTLGLTHGGTVHDSALSNLNPAPSKLAPPDYSSASPMMDETYLSSQADYHFTMGETLSFEGQTARSIEEYKSTLIYDPKSVHVRLRLAAEYVRAGMITEAVEQGEIAVDMDPESVEAHMLLGGLYSGLKMFGPAVEQFQAILNHHPGHPEASIYLGALLAEERKYDESIKYFEALSKNKSFKEPEKAYYYIGRVRAEQGPRFHADAKKAFNKALELKPEYPEAVLALGMLDRSDGKENEMERLFRSYSDKYGPDREMARQLSRYYLEKENFDKALEQLEALDGFERDNLNVKIQIALILIEQKKYEAAAERLEDVLQQAPDSDKVRYYLGAVYEEMGQSALAEEHYLKIQPGSAYFAEAVVHSANLQKTSGHIDRAIQILEKSLEQQEDLPQLYAFYATLLDEKKAYQKALKMLSMATERFPTNTQLRFFLGTMHDRVGNPEETIVQMNKVLEQDKDHVQALNYLAYTYAEMGKNLDEAADLAARALSLQPNDGYILDTVGWIYFKKGHIEDAIKYLEAACKVRSDEPIIAEHLGDAYLRHQLWQRAQKMYQKAASLETDHDRSQKLQDKIANLLQQSQRPARMPASLKSQ